MPDKRKILFFFRYRDENLVMIEGEYSNNGRKAFYVEDEFGENYCTLSVNIPNIPLDDECVFIKNYSENEEIYNFLKNRGFLAPTGVYVSSGFVSIPECFIGDFMPKEK